MSILELLWRLTALGSVISICWSHFSIHRRLKRLESVKLLSVPHEYQLIADVSGRVSNQELNHRELAKRVGKLEHSDD